MLVFRYIVVVLLFLSNIGLKGEQAVAPKKVAIIIANRVSEDLNRQIPVFEDCLTALLTDKGFGIISRDVVISAIGDLESGLTQHESDSLLEDMISFFGDVRNSMDRNKLDAVLDDQTSALRLAQNSGADYILFASIMDFSQEKREVSAYNVNFTNNVYTLQASYRILSGITGESLTAGIAEAERKIQSNKHSKLSLTNLEGELLTEVAVKLSEDLALKESNNRIRTVKVDDAKVDVGIVITLSNITFPEVIINEDGTGSVIDRISDVQALGVTVELDGFVIGTTSNSGVSNFRVTPGLHRMRLLRDDLVTWERMINVQDGMELNVEMNLTKAAALSWLAKIKIYDSLKTNATLNAAEVELLRSEGQMLRQSGFKVDLKDVAEKNITVDTDEAVQIHNKHSLINND